MIAFLTFTFASFWHFAGVVLLLSLTCGLVEAMGRAMFRVICAFMPHAGECELDQKVVIDIVARDVAQGGSVWRAVRNAASVTPVRSQSH